MCIMSFYGQRKYGWGVCFIVVILPVLRCVIGDASDLDFTTRLTSRTRSCFDIFYTHENALFMLDVIIQSTMQWPIRDF